MNESHLQLVRMAAFAAAVGFASVLERVRPHAGQGGSVRTNVGLWAVDAVVLGAVCGGCACAVGSWAAARGVGVLNVLAAPLWMAVPVTVVGLDLVSYGWHRANHGVPLLWRFHSVHHADPRFTASTGLRFHPGELLLSLPVRLVAIVALGAPAVAIVAFEACFAVANFFEHGDIDLPLGLERAVDRVVVTPALASLPSHARARRPRPQLRHHPRRLGPAARNVPRELVGGAGGRGLEGSGRAARSLCRAAAPAATAAGALGCPAHQALAQRNARGEVDRRPGHRERAVDQRRDRRPASRSGR